MGDALDRLYVLFAKTFVARHKSVSATGKIEDVESHWRELPASVRKTFKESMHAPSVQGGQSHPFDTPDARPLKDLTPGEQAVYKAVKQNVGERKAEALKAKVGTDTRSAGYLKAPSVATEAQRFDRAAAERTRREGQASQAYEAEKRRMPMKEPGQAKVPVWLRPGKRVTTPDGQGNVIGPVGQDAKQFFVEVDGIEDEYGIDDLEPADKASKDLERKMRAGYRAAQYTHRQPPPHAPA